MYLKILYSENETVGSESPTVRILPTPLYCNFNNNNSLLLPVPKNELAILKAFYEATVFSKYFFYKLDHFRNGFIVV